MPQMAPASQGVTRDLRTGRMLYSLDEIRDRHKRRPGRGNWGGIGARARQKVSEREAL